MGYDTTVSYTGCGLGLMKVKHASLRPTSARHTQYYSVFTTIILLLSNLGTYFREDTTSCNFSFLCRSIRKIT